MEQVRVLEGGIVKIPEEFRRKLKLQDGDKAVFTEDSKGNIIIENASLYVLPTLECGFWGLGQKVGISDEHDIVRFVREFRKEGRE